jgi:hypothetical protein
MSVETIEIFIYAECVMLSAECKRQKAKIKNPMTKFQYSISKYPVTSYFRLLTSDLFCSKNVPSPLTTVVKQQITT